jgi:hypothetical protein
LTRRRFLAISGAAAMNAKGRAYGVQAHRLGWSSTKDHIGVYFINPSNEYIGGSPDKPE